MAFGFYSPISVNAAQVPSTQTDFPMLVNVTDARFKTVANSGHVQSSSGFDIRPYTDSTLGTAITGYELERYNASTGEVIMWVKIASLSSSTTPLVLAYGNAALTTDGSSAATWSNSFTSVFHFKDGTTLSVADSVGNHNGTNHSATATAGQIDGGLGTVSASSQYVSLGAFATNNAITYSAWVNATSFPNAYNTIVGAYTSGAAAYQFFYVKSTGKLAFNLNNAAGYDGTGSHTLSSGTWYYICATYDGTVGTVGYVNAASDATHAASGGLNTSSETVDIGRDTFANGNNWNGTLDEVRYASIARSANWITTEYNNQFAPGTFATLGTEAAFGGGTRNSNWLLFFT